MIVNTWGSLILGKSYLGDMRENVGGCLRVLLLGRNTMTMATPNHLIGVVYVSEV